jgi:hypothetical protein
VYIVEAGLSPPKPVCIRRNGYRSLILASFQFFKKIDFMILFLVLVLANKCPFHWKQLTAQNRLPAPTESGRMRDK